MEVVILKMLFIASVSAQFGKHEYVPQKYNWHHAQAHCRSHYTDLSPITTSLEEATLKNATSEKVFGEFWIGLHSNKTHWKWSGGRLAADIPWAPSQPDDNLFASVCWHNCTKWTGWHAHAVKKKQLPFFCLNLKVVEEKKSWQEALEHCRESRTNLPSLLSETELLLAQTEIQHNHITDRVWIGLRYLGSHWLWVSGDPLVYRAWSKGGGQDHQCPIKNRCGVLTKEGLWEEWDCQDRLNFICD